MKKAKTGPRGSMKCVSSCTLTRIDIQGSGTTWRISPFWAQTTTPKTQLVHMTYCVVTRNQNHHTKYTRHQHKLRSSKVAIKRKTRQTQETMGDHFQYSCAIAVRKQDIMQVISHRQHPTPALDHNKYKWDSPWPRPQRMRLPPTSLTQIGSF